MKSLMFKIPPHETKVVGRLFAYSLLIAASYVVARTVGDSLFLSRVGNAQLALVYVLSGCLTAVAAGIWYFATRKLSISRSIQLSGVLFAMLNLSAWILLPIYHHSFLLLACIYLMAEVKGCINAINIVSALNAKLGREASKSSWTAIGLAAPIAAVFAGGVFALEYNFLDLRTWLLVGAFLDIASCALGALVGRSQPKVKSGLPSPPLNASESNGQKSKKIYVCSNRFRFWIGVLIAAKVVVLTIVSFEWKSSVNSFYERDPEILIRFFGIYYGVVGVATIGMQLLVTKQLLIRRNFSLPILLMPIMLLGVAFSVVVGSGLVIVLASTFGKSLDVWRRSVHDTTLNLLYTRIDRAKRRSTITFNKGLLKPLAEVLAAGAIFLGSAPIHRPLFAFTLLVWILAAIQLIRLVKAGRLQGIDNEESELNGMPELKPTVWSSNPFQV